MVMHLHWFTAKPWLSTWDDYHSLTDKLSKNQQTSSPWLYCSSFNPLIYLPPCPSKLTLVLNHCWFCCLCWVKLGFWVWFWRPTIPCCMFCAPACMFPYTPCCCCCIPIMLLFVAPIPNTAAENSTEFSSTNLRRSFLAQSKIDQWRFKIKGHFSSGTDSKSPHYRTKEASCSN